MLPNAVEHEKMRRELWCKVCVAIARSDTPIAYNSLTNYATAALAGFDKEFPRQIGFNPLIDKTADNVEAFYEK